MTLSEAAKVLDDFIAQNITCETCACCEPGLFNATCGSFELADTSSMCEEHRLRDRGVEAELEKLQEIVVYLELEEWQKKIQCGFRTCAHCEDISNFWDCLCGEIMDEDCKYYEHRVLCPHCGLKIEEARYGGREDRQRGALPEVLRHCRKP